MRDVPGNPYAETEIKVLMCVWGVVVGVLKSPIILSVLSIQED